MGVVSKYKKLGPELFFKKLLGYEAVFACAYRRLGEKTLYEGNSNSTFTLVPIEKEAWFADPLLFEYDNRTFLFMESWSYETRKGTIICSELIGDTVTKPQTVIKEDFHMSFPNVFCYKNEIYMIPETEESGGINIYKSLDFPYKWEKVSFIKTPFPIVDIIIESIEDDIFYLQGSTFKSDNLEQTYFYTFKLDFSKKELILEELDYSNRSYENRNAGRFIELSESNGIHCIQRSTKAIYGYSTKFIHSIKEDKRWNDQSNNALEILPSDITLNKKIKLIGTHTYSISSEYEVIDIEYLKWSPKNIINQIKKRL